MLVQTRSRHFPHQSRIWFLAPLVLRQHKLIHGTAHFQRGGRSALRALALIVNLLLTAAAPLFLLKHFINVLQFARAAVMLDEDSLNKRPDWVVYEIVSSFWLL
jgi:hypothetical protein